MVDKWCHIMISAHLQHNMSPCCLESWVKHLQDEEPKAALISSNTERSDAKACVVLSVQEMSEQDVQLAVSGSITRR